MDKQFANYLAETKMLDFSAYVLKNLIQKRGWNSLAEAEKVKAIYNFVRDEILFGYNVSDKIAASRVLADGFGQCNTKGTLLMALLRACGVPCRIHGFTIDKILQKGAMTGFVYKSAPKEIFHSYVEAYVCGKWYNLEGFILDSGYLVALQRKFTANADGSFVGYGVATKNFACPPVDFDLCETYIQNEGIVRDFGVYDSPDLLLAEHGQQTGFCKRFGVQACRQTSDEQKCAQNKKRQLNAHVCNLAEMPFVKWAPKCGSLCKGS